MSDELRRSERSVDRLDYALLGSTGERVIVSTSSSQVSATVNLPIDVPEAEESSKPSVKEPTFLDRIQLPSDTEDRDSVTSGESSSESTITASSDSNVNNKHDSRHIEYH